MIQSKRKWWACLVAALIALQTFMILPPVRNGFADASAGAADSGVLETFSSTPDSTKVPWGSGPTDDQIQPKLVADAARADESWSLNNPSNITAEMNVNAEFSVDSSLYNAVQIDMYFDKLPVFDNVPWDNMYLKLCSTEWTTGYEFYIVSNTSSYIKTTGWQTITVPLDEMSAVGGGPTGEINRFYFRTFCTTHADIRVSEIRFVKLTENPVFESFTEAPSSVKVPWQDCDATSVAGNTDHDPDDRGWKIGNSSNKEMNVVAERAIDPSNYNALEIDAYFSAPPKYKSNNIEIWLTEKGSNYKKGFQFNLQKYQYVPRAGWQTITVRMDEMSPREQGYDGGKLDAFYVKFYTESQITLSEFRFVQLEEQSLLESFSEVGANKITWGAGGSDTEVNPTLCTDESGNPGGAWSIAGQADKVRDMNFYNDNLVNFAGFDAVEIRLYISNRAALKTANLRLARETENFRGYDLRGVIPGKLERDGWQTVTLLKTEFTDDTALASGKIQGVYLEVALDADAELRLGEIRFIKIGDSVLENFNEISAEKIPYGLGSGTEEARPELIADESGAENEAWRIAGRASEIRLQAYTENLIVPAVYNAVKISLNVSDRSKLGSCGFVLADETDGEVWQGYELDVAAEVSASGWQEIVVLKSTWNAAGYRGGKIKGFALSAELADGETLALGKIEFVYMPTVRTESEWKSAIQDTARREIMISGRLELTENYVIDAPLYVYGLDHAELSFNASAAWRGNIYDYEKLAGEAALTIKAPVTLCNISLSGVRNLGIFVDTAGELTAENVTVRDFKVAQLGVLGAVTGDVILDGGQYRWFASDTADVESLPENVCNLQYTAKVSGDISLTTVLQSGDGAIATVTSATLDGAASDLSELIENDTIHADQCGKYVLQGTLTVENYVTLPFTATISVRDSLKPVIAKKNPIPTVTQGQECDVTTLFTVSDNVSAAEKIEVTVVLQLRFEQITLDGTKFVPTKAGVYTVGVTARDEAGNIATEEFEFTVTDAQKPVIKGLDAVSKKIKAGARVDLSGITAEDETAADCPVTIIVTKDGKEIKLDADFGFVAEAGEYRITVSSSDGVNIETEEFVIHATGNGGCGSRLETGAGLIASIALAGAALILTLRKRQK